MNDARHNLGDGVGDEETTRDPHESFDELTRATARPGPSPAWRSDESAALRETWLAFGKLLDAAAGPADVDRRALVEAVRSRNLRRDRRSWWLGAAAALGGLAAAIVIAVVIARSGETDCPTAPTQLATSRRAVAPVEKADLLPSRDGLPPVAVASTQSLVVGIGWDDQMGGRLEPLRRDVRRLQAGPNRHTESVDSLRARMSALREDWGRNRL